MATATLFVPPAKLANEFRLLTDRWTTDTANVSSPTAIATHPAYQRIIGFGPQAIPLILHELAREPRQWFWALAALTGADPVPAGDRGRVRAMAAAWLGWGRENGWIE